MTCFWVEPTGTVYRYLRRYTNSGDAATEDQRWTCAGGWHEAKVMLDEVAATADDRGFIRAGVAPDDFVGHRLWPTECEKGCGYRFTAEPGPSTPPAEVGDSWQVALDRVLGDGHGQRWALRDLPAGAMYDATWLPWKGPDGRALTVVLPDGTGWRVDGEASNCNRRGQPHFCWPRTGEPPNVTVDKALGDTCSAGGGSIASKGFHGFLRNGQLVGV